MRNLLCIIFVVCAINAYGQSPSSDYRSQGRMIPMTSLGATENKQDVQQRFLRQEWSPAVVSFRNSPDQWHVPVIFDMYSNKLYFLNEKVIMEFVDTVSQFTMIIINGEDSNLITFRAFYPAIQKNTPDIFYEVLVDGDYQLLKCKAKTIYQYKEQDIPEEERRYNRELYYAYLPGYKMIPVKKDKEQLLAALPPEELEKFQKIIESKKIKIKNEESLKQVFRYINEEN